MKVAFFVQYCHTAGTYFRWHNLAIALQRAGLSVDVYAGDFNYKAKPRKELRDGVSYFITPSLISCRIFTNPSDPFSAVRRLFNLPEKEYDVYHLFQPFLQAYIPWNYLRKKKQGIFVYDWDDLWTGGLFEKPKSLQDRFVQKVVMRLERTLPDQADGVTVCSSLLQSRIPDTADSVLIYNGFWERPKMDKDTLRRKWNFEEHVFYLAYIGKTGKEIYWLKSAVDTLHKSMKSFRLLIAGPPEQTIREAGLADHPLILYMGEKRPEEANELIAASDLGLLPMENSVFNQSRFPIRFFDFISNGTPVYFSGVGELKKIGSNFDNALEGSADPAIWSSKLVDAIQKVNSNTGMFDREVGAAYSWPAVANRTSNFYQTLIDARKK